MTLRSEFNPYREHPFRGSTRSVFFGVMLLLVVIAPAVTVEPTPGVSGEVYRVYEEHQVWRSVGPVLSVRYSTEHRTRSSVEAEAQDLLPLVAARADSAQLQYVLIGATRPIARIGNRFGVYRGWNFRFERAVDGWVSSGYW